jgi:PAS domain S-box-containing protein
MNYFWSYCYFGSAVLFFILAVIIIGKGWRSPLNLTCAAVFLCYGIWNFGSTWVHNPATPLNDLEFYSNVGSIGWLFFPLFFLWFSWLYSRKPRKKLLLPIIAFAIIIPTIFMYEQFANSALIDKFQYQSWGWYSYWTSTFWTYLYYTYYFFSVCTGLGLIFFYRLRSDNPSVRRHSLILMLTAVISVFIGTISNVIIPMVLHAPSVPVANMTSLIWAFGLAYTVFKYDSLNITAVIAAQQIITVMKDLLFLLDLRGTIISVNVSAARTLSCSQSQLIGRRFGDLIVENESGSEDVFGNICRAESYSKEILIGIQPGMQIPVSLTSNIIPNTGIVCVAHDITLERQRTESLKVAKQVLESEVIRATEELRNTNVVLTNEITVRKQAAQMLMETEERFRVIFENAPDGIYLADKDGLLLDANREIMRIVNVDKSLFIGKPVDSIGLSGGFSHQDITISYREETVKRSDSTVVPVETTVYPIRIGNREHFLGIIRDLTQKKKSEAFAEQLRLELQQAQKMEAIGRLAGGIAHDFNNLLAGIVGYAGLLQQQFSKSHPTALKNIEKIKLISRDASKRIEQLLAFARKGKYKIETVDMHQLIEDVIDILRHTIDKRINLKAILNAQHQFVSGDRSQLHSALLNIGVNARDALPGGGEIVFTTEIVELHINEKQDSEVQAKNHDSFFRVMISDNGIGMDEETYSRVFEPFYTTKERGKGTGLGMASVYGTIKNHNGFIELKSQLGNGTSCIISLPLCSELQVADPLPEVVLPFSKKQAGTVMVVDDVSYVRETIVENLEIDGYSVYDFADGYAALEWYRTHHDLCDIVILDYTMPIMNGRECFMALKEINPNIRVIITSGHALDDEISGILAMGSNAFIKKPFECDTLTDIVKNTMYHQITS